MDQEQRLDQEQKGDPAVREHHVVGTETIGEGFGQKFLFDDEGDGPPHEILVVRVDGKLHALHSLCPHAGGRLAEGPLARGRYPSCPLHLYKFDPETGEALDVECDPATIYEIEESEGEGEAVIRVPG